MKNNENILTSTILYATVAFIAISTLGVLAIPVLLAIMHGIWYWLFLYIVYMLVAAFAVPYISTSTPKRGGSQCVG